MENGKKHVEKIFQEIESSKQILDERELNKIINEYNTMFEDFAKLVDAYNLHYENEIIKLRKNIFQEIIVLAENYAKNNKIDFLFNGNNIS